ncbi:Fidipidine, putative isoform 2 [Hibiscus syriacus]|uniref:Fidipidine, putative isoform 2 n=1 Tax=Hibiscus syriacus TaxID=106335 RepID=A0A6A3B130_HIBSY|nr:Fidipidine, putative isoform 2 [Hibiscus syriacus]
MQEDSSDQEFNSIRASIAILNSNLDQQNQRKNSVLNELQNLQEKIRKEGAESKIQKLVSLLENLKEVEVSDLEEKLATGSDNNMLSHSLEDSLNQSLQKLNLAKRELAARLREIVSIKIQLDNAPSQSELIRYECRFSELNAHIQFQDAIASLTGRMKLLESMEKLEKVQIGLQKSRKLVMISKREQLDLEFAVEQECQPRLLADDLIVTIHPLLHFKAADCTPAAAGLSKWDRSSVSSRK